MKKFLTLFIFLSCRSVPSHQEIDLLLNNLHQHASDANGKAYFDLFSKDAVFFGTDISERWNKAAFKEYGTARFADGDGWTYHMKERNIFFSDDGKTCWFDEILNNEKYGEFRGTGVLKIVMGKWKIVQYNLLLPIPNDLFMNISKEIKNFYN